MSVPPLLAVDIVQIHLDGTEEPLLTVTMETPEFDVLDGTPRYLVESDFERITYPPLILLTSQRIEFPKDDINPDATAAEDDE